jgi:hypothetical protein
MKKQGIMILPKDHSSSQATFPKEKETDEMPGKEFKGMILREINEIQENADNSTNQEYNFQVILLVLG